MQYQHLVFEEFARKIQPNINVFLVPDGFDVTIDPSIVAEFAHVVYRFGHSMLTETIDRFDPSFNADHIGLIEGFLNPIAVREQWQHHGVDADIAAGAIIRGMTRQVGNEIDEFVTSALRNNLLGLPLDLATINLARGRDTGVPSLNEARRAVLRGDQRGLAAQALRELGRFRRPPQARSLDHQLHRRLRHARADHRRHDGRRQARRGDGAEWASIQARVAKRWPLCERKLRGRLAGRWCAERHHRRARKLHLHAADRLDDERARAACSIQPPRVTNNASS